MRRLLMPTVLLMLAACSSGGSSDGPVTEAPEASEATEVTQAPAATDASDGNTLSTEVATTDASAVDATSETTPDVTIAEVDRVEPLINDALLISTVTPEVVDTLRPVLEWEPVDGAESYSVVVLDETGVPYWAWEGPESGIRLGGGVPTDAGIGPIIGVDYSWSVAAFGSEGVFLAISGQMPISTE